MVRQATNGSLSPRRSTFAEAIYHRPQPGRYWRSGDWCPLTLDVPADGSSESTASTLNLFVWTTAGKEAESGFWQSFARD
jgi:hypothetical protein